MNGVYQKLLPLLCCAVLIILPSITAAQRALGVRWEIPENPETAINQLGRFQNLGITRLEINELANATVWKELTDREFRVYVQIPVRYPVVNTYAEPDSVVVSIYQNYISHYSGHDIEALGVFEYGQTGSSRFTDAVSPFITRLQSVPGASLYIKDWNYRSQPVDSLLDFKMVKTEVDRNFTALPDSLFTGIGAFLYHPAPELQQYIAPLKWFLEKTSINSQAVLFFESDWLLSFVDAHPGIAEILVRYSEQPDPVFPLPSESLPTESRYSGIVLVLLILWGSFAFNYSLEPTYRKSLFRYFFSHKFFIEDVMKRHIRSLLPGLLILLQHAVMGGIVFYCFAGQFFTKMGLDVVFTYFPAFGIFGTEHFSFFIAGTLLTLLFELICLGWLYLSNMQLNHMGQITILYSWSFQLNFLITTLLVTLLITDSGPFIPVFFFVLFLLVATASFLITAVDTGQFLRKQKAGYWLGTVGLYLVAIGGFWFWIFSNSYLHNIFRLASSVSS